MPATATTTRYFGKCDTKGCKTRRITDAGPGFSFTHNGTRHSLTRHIYGWNPNQAGQRAAHFQTMRDLDLVCPTHNKLLTWQSGTFTYNPRKVCNGTCMSAKGPSCDCSCGGENHGRGHAIALL